MLSDGFRACLSLSESLITSSRVEGSAVQLTAGSGGPAGTIETRHPVSWRPASFLALRYKRESTQNYT